MFKKYNNKDWAQYITIENKSKVELHGVRSGERKKLKTDKDGIPFDYHWRRRLKDSKIDGSVEIVAEENMTTTTEGKNEEDLTHGGSNE